MGGIFYFVGSKVVFIGVLMYDFRTGLTSEVGYPYLEIMVTAKVPVEVVLVAPIWGHCGIQSQVKAIITPVSNESSMFSVDVSSFVVQQSGKVTVDSSHGLLGSVLMGVCGIPCESLWLITSTGSGVTFDAVILQHGRLGDAPDGLASVYEQNFYLRFPGSRQFEGMRPFVSRFQDLGPLSLRLPCAWHEYFCVGSMVLRSLLLAWSHSFCQRANLSALVYGFYDNSCPLGGIRRPPGCGWFSYKSPSLPQPRSSRYEPSHPFAS
eukprot:Gb_15495 [translate_table: standard]